QAVTDLRLPEEYGARVRLTGPVPIADEQFATVQEGMVVNGIATVAIVLVILWLALKSGKIIFAVFVNLVIGLAVTAALGFLIVGRSEEHTSELQSRRDLVCRLLLEKK